MVTSYEEILKIRTMLTIIFKEQLDKNFFSIDKIEYIQKLNESCYFFKEMDSNYYKNEKKKEIEASEKKKEEKEKMYQQINFTYERVKQLEKKLRRINTRSKRFKI